MKIIILTFKYCKPGMDILVDLERKVALVKPELENREIGFALCSRSGFPPQLVEDVGRRYASRLIVV